MIFEQKNKTAAVFIILAVIFLGADRILKALALSGGGYAIAGDFFQFRLARNYHIAFSIPLGGPVLTVVTAAIIGALIFYAVRERIRRGLSGALAGATVLVIAGALSNLCDRMVYGYVIDYLDLRYFTVFNLADTMIVGGAAAIVWLRAKKDGG